MKIGIVTFYRVANYGAMLQAYSLWHYLADRGHDVVFIRQPLVAPGRISLLECAKSRSIQSLKTKLKQRIRYSMTSFAAVFPQTEMCGTWDDLKRVGNACDLYIVGSDQMWNPLWSSREHLRFVMLDFVAEQWPRLSYAVSFGAKIWPKDQNAAEAAELMKKFAAISVREKSGLGLVRQLTGRPDVCWLPDPTLLQTADFYRVLFSEGFSAEPYIFKYFLDEWSDAAAEESALKCIQEVLHVKGVQTDQIKADWQYPLCALMGVKGKISVSEWLRRIAQSHFVITNSFHGTIFAILFHKPFVSLLLKGKMSGMNERMISLLTALGIPERAVEADSYNEIRILAQKPVDWQAVDSGLDEMREAASRFLDVNLKQN